MKSFDHIDTRVDIKSLLPIKNRELESFPCDFHPDPRSSALIQDNLYQCSCCDVVLTPTEYLSQRLKVPLEQAAWELARRNNIETTKAHQYMTQKVHKGHNINSAVANMCHALLSKKVGEECARYVSGRGLTKATIDSFQLGYFPKQDELLDILLNKFGEDDLLTYGLLAKSKAGNLYWPFKDRLLFPIKNAFGNCVGFGARDLSGKSDIKYINTSHNHIFKKSNEMYAAHSTSSQKAVVFEGYMDVISYSAHSANYNAYAPLGTALNKGHLRTLLSSHDLVIECLDGDRAGIQAMKKTAAFMSTLNHSDNLRIAIMPEGLDPDEYIRTHGIKRFDQDILGKALTVTEAVEKFAETKFAHHANTGLHKLAMLDDVYLQPAI